MSSKILSPEEWAKSIDYVWGSKPTVWLMQEYAIYVRDYYLDLAVTKLIDDVQGYQYSKREILNLKTDKSLQDL